MKQNPALTNIKKDNLMAKVKNVIEYFIINQMTSLFLLSNSTVFIWQL